MRLIENDKILIIRMVISDQEYEEPWGASAEQGIAIELWREARLWVAATNDHFDENCEFHFHFHDDQ